MHTRLPKPFVQTFTVFLFSFLSGSNAGDPEVDTQALESGQPSVNYKKNKQ